MTLWTFLPWWTQSLHQPPSPALRHSHLSNMLGIYRLRDEFAAERAKLEAIRDHMVEDMEKKGVNPKYLAEMKMADIRKLQMR